MIAHAREAYPAECCGLLVGRGDQILLARPARNLAEDPNRFLIDPQDHIEALRDARARGLAVVGFYHSHPHSPPAASPTDIAEASYEHHFYLIVSLATVPPALCLYVLKGGRFEEVPA